MPRACISFALVTAAAIAAAVVQNATANATANANATGRCAVPTANATAADCTTAHDSANANDTSATLADAEIARVIAANTANASADAFTPNASGCAHVEIACFDVKLKPISYTSEIVEDLANATLPIGACIDAAYIVPNTTRGDNCSAMRAAAARANETVLHDRARKIARAYWRVIVNTSTFLYYQQRALELERGGQDPDANASDASDT